ncbi:MAG: YebC/PmpR family DNA-binding transcriptional regulator [Pseudomonadota bacterium]|nr:YebC/PmpR family DNA-binding transcriptional regulator [Pseudomonadota bacterium]
MAGHSKWANIQHRKGIQDAKRGKLFTKLIREITVSVRLSGNDTATNPRLRVAVDKALAQNMTKDTIERAIKRGEGNQESDNYEEIRYEGYGPGGVAVMVDCLTDNRKRTVADVRYAFSKCGGNLGTDGSVAYLFEKVGQLNYPSGSDEDQIMEVALEAGAEDVIRHADDSIEVLTTPETFDSIKTALNQAHLLPEQAEVTMRARSNSALDLENAQKMVRLLELLEDLDDVQSVYSNADISDDIMAQMS